MTPDGRHRVLHVLDGDFASGYFPDLARFADGDRFELVFTSLRAVPDERAARLERPGVSRYRPPPAPVDGYSRGNRARGTAGAVGGLMRLIGALRPDVVHAHLFEPALLGTLAAAGRGTPARVVGRHHSDLLHGAGRPLHVGLDRLATRLAHAVITNSEFTKRVMVEHESATPAKLRVVYYGLDTHALQPAPAAEIEALRRELGLEQAAFVLLVPARLDRAKGHEHLFDALVKLRQDGTALPTVLLAGHGPARALFERRVAELGLASSVRFLGHRTDIHQLYQAADVTVLPSLSEAFGQVLIESLCFGTAVVATRVGGIPEIVEDGRTGLLVAPADPDDLARALRESRDRPDGRDAMAAAGRAFVRETFDSRRTARGNEAIYEELLARAARRMPARAAASVGRSRR